MRGYDSDGGALGSRRMSSCRCSSRICADASEFVEDEHASDADRDERHAEAREDDAPEDEGEFIPEDPPSLAGTDPLTMLAWLAAAGSK